jgi:ribosomal protein L37E
MTKPTQAIIDARPQAFEGMPYWGSITTAHVEERPPGDWFRLGLAVARWLNSIDGDHPARASFLLPGEPGCPPLPEAWRRTTGQRGLCRLALTGRWEVRDVVRAEGWYDDGKTIPWGANLHARAIPVPDGYTLEPRRDGESLTGKPGVYVPTPSKTCSAAERRAGKTRASGIRCTRCGDGRVVEREGKQFCTACGWRFGEAARAMLSMVQGARPLGPAANNVLCNLGEMREVLWAGGHMLALHDGDGDVAALWIKISDAMRALERHLADKLEAPF